MILSHDRERGRVSLSTKKLEPTPGDMIRNPKLVFEKVSKNYICTCAEYALANEVTFALDPIRLMRWLRYSGRE
jgi:hypothetical protein